MMKVFFNINMFYLYIITKFIYFIIFFKCLMVLVKKINGDWGLGIGDWGLGIGDWAQAPIPNPQSPIPNPHNL